MIVAKWRDRTFEVSESRIASFRDMAINLDVETSEKTSSNQTYVTRKAVKARTVTMTAPLSGEFSDVNAEIAAWMALADGTGGRIYLGETALIDCDFLLSKCAVSKTTMTGAGRIMSAEIALTFTQSSVMGGTSAGSATKKKKKKKKKSKKSSSGVSGSVSNQLTNDARNERAQLLKEQAAARQAAARGQTNLFK